MKYISVFSAVETESENLDDHDSIVNTKRDSMDSTSGQSMPDSVSSDNEISAKLEEDKPYIENVSEPFLQEFPKIDDTTWIVFF